MFFSSAKKVPKTLKNRFLGGLGRQGFSSVRVFENFGPPGRAGFAQESSDSGLILVSKLNTLGTPWRGAADFSKAPRWSKKRPQQ